MNFKRTAICRIFCALMAAMFLAGTTTAASLVGRWTMDDNAASVAVSEVTGAYPGIFMDGVNPHTDFHHSPDCREGTGSLSFDGVDDYVAIPGYQGIAGSASRTCMAWIKTSGSASNMVILNWGANVSGQQWLFGIFSTGKLTVYAGGPYIQTNATVTDGQWHHVAAVLADDGSPVVSDITLYIDGALQAVTSSSGTAAIATVSGPDAALGSFEYAPGLMGFFFPGLMDDVRIYDEALSPEAIGRLAGQAFGHWAMDDNAATATVADRAGRYNGTFSDSTNPATSFHHSTTVKEGTGSLSFDGVDDSISLPRNAVLETGGISTRQLSASAWIKDTSGGAAGYGTVIGTGDGGWVLARNGDHMIAGVWVNNIYNQEAFGSITSNTNISDGQWHHVAFVSTPTMLYLYVDGVRSTFYISRGTYIKNKYNKGVLLGENASVAGRYWKGLMDNVKIYDYALTADQIHAEIAENNYHFENPGYAWNPSPVDNQTGFSNSELLWSAGHNAVSHDVYFGTDMAAVASAARLAGDINGDGPVDILDLSILAGQWLTANPLADIAFSGKVDLEDLAVLASDWHQPPNPAFKGNQADSFYHPGPLTLGTTYYWRIDEVDASDGDSPWAGRVWSFKPVIKIMPLGDSITYDNYGDDPRPSGERTGYRSHLWYALQNAGYPVDFVGNMTAGEAITPAFDPDNEGHGGWTSGNIATYVYGWLQATPADIILLHIGTNGLTTSTTAVQDILNEIDRYESDYGRHITVLLARIINRYPYSSTTTTFNNNVAAMAQTRIANGDDIVVVDMENGAGIVYATDLRPDGLHPYDSGYQKMAALWFSTLQTLLP